MTWQQILRKNFTSIDALADFLELKAPDREKIIRSKPFPLNLPFRLAMKMKKGTIEDPLFKQFVPISEERVITEGFMEDPVEDQSFAVGKKLLHKYKGRVLLVCTGACAMHCRYCFRKNFPYENSKGLYHEELLYIQRETSINEVILSGGDPLSLPDRILEGLFSSLSTIEHVKRVRFHSRFPIGIPERIDDQFLKLLKKIKQKIWFVLHINHPNELDDDVFFSLSKLQNEGVLLLNQSVLLKGVNDEVPILKELCLKLVDNGIFPYYLHQLDCVQGAAHFEIPVDKGVEIIQTLQKELPGYAVPKYVSEIPGRSSKTTITISDQ